MHLSRILEISRTCGNSMDVDNYFMPLRLSFPVSVSSPLFPLPLLTFVAVLSQNRWVWYVQKDASSSSSSVSWLGFVARSLHSCISASYPHTPTYLGWKRQKYSFMYSISWIWQRPSLTKSSHCRCPQSWWHMALGSISGGTFCYIVFSLGSPLPSNVCHHCTCCIHSNRAQSAHLC